MTEKVVEIDPELSAHLALSALASFREAGENPAQAVSLLRTAIENDRVTFRVPGGRFVAVHPDGALIATSDFAGDEIVGVAVWDIATREIVERYARPDDMDPGDGWHTASFSPDGNLLAVNFELAEPSVTIWDRTTGESFHIGTHPGNFLSPVFSPDGALVALVPEDSDVGVQVWSVAERRVIFETGDGGNLPEFNADGLMGYAVDDESGESGESSVRVINPVTGELIDSFPTDLDSLFFTSWSPDETLLATGNQIEIIVFDAATGAEFSRTAGRLFEPVWLPDGDSYVVGGELNPRVIDAATGEVGTEFFGLTGGTWHYQVVPGSSRLAAASLGGDETVIFDTSPLGGVELGGWVAPIGTATVDYADDGDRVIASDLFTSYVTADAIDGSQERVLGPGPGDWRVEVNHNGTFVASQGSDGIWSVRVVETDEVIYEAPDGMVIRHVS